MPRKRSACRRSSGRAGIARTGTRRWPSRIESVNCGPSTCILLLKSGRLLMDHADGNCGGRDGGDRRQLHDPARRDLRRHGQARTPTGTRLIGHACVLGAGATILGNIKVGDGATVGSQAVVTKDVPRGHDRLSASTSCWTRTSTRSARRSSRSARTWQYEVDTYDGCASRGRLWKSPSSRVSPLAPARIILPNRDRLRWRARAPSRIEPGPQA